MPEESSISELLEPTRRWSVVRDAGKNLPDTFSECAPRRYYLISDNIEFIEADAITSLLVEISIEGVQAEQKTKETGNWLFVSQAYAKINAAEKLEELIEDGTVPSYELFGMDDFSNGTKLVKTGLAEWWYLSLAAGKTVDELKASSMVTEDDTTQLYEAQLNTYQSEVERKQQALASEKAHEELMLEYDRMAERHNQRMAYIRQKTEEHRRRKAR